ncbi:hypothetical protein PVAND_004410 [Polypedilum vanderplanki]|uniref:Uncharacterized protein n=1 Tax=Polypedilum vanderplanki TaxID=319348 RepID=A0A9J6BX33_POLVA|nr:hypothetical protein PVAND_004410 [Polypedilum vanderplanki]
MITKLIDAAVKTESLETEKSQFIKEIEEMRSSSHELKESVELINKKCSTLNEEIQEKSQIIEKHEQEKLKLINDLENTNALKTSISLELETIKNNQSTAITEYQAQLDKLQTNLEDRLLELSNLEAKYQHITKENKDLIGKVTSLNDFIDKQKSEMKELEMLNQLSENEQKKQNSKLREEELVNELNKSRNQTVNNDVEKLRSEFETISDQLINSLEDNAKLQQEFNEKVLKIQELQEKIDQHEKIDCQYKKIEEILKNNQEIVQIDETDDLIEMITKLIDAAVKTESLETEKSQFIKEIEEMRSSSHELKESVELINKKCSALNEEIQEKSQIIEKHEQEKLKLINELKNTNALKTSISLELETIKNNQSTAITEYQAQLDKLQTNLEDRLLELSNLEAKYQHITKENENLTKNMKIVNESLAQQTTENFNNAQIILDLHRKNKEMLTELQNYKDQPKKNVSPTQNRRSGENLENEAYALQRKQLQIESNHGTPVRAMKTNLDRKTRRQSVYDENRRLSTWELISSVETQTENVDDICACKENAEKIKELELEIRRKQIIINNNELMAKCNPLKVDLADIKMKYEREMRNNKLLKTSMESLEEELAKFRSQQHLTSQNLNLSSQYVAKTEYNKLFNEKISLEKKLNDAKRQRANSSEKENVGVNTSFNNIQSNDELDSLKKAHNELLRKYDMAKRLCNLRLDDLNTLRKELATKDDDIAVKDQEIMRMTNKYQEAKRICLLRMETIKSLRERLGEVPWTPLNPSEGFSHESDVTDKQA